MKERANGVIFMPAHNSYGGFIAMKQVYHTLLRIFYTLVPMAGILVLSSCGLLELRVIPTSTMTSLPPTQPVIIFPTSTLIPTKVMEETQIPPPTATQQVIASPTSTLLPSPTPRCNDKAGFVTDVSVPDNTTFTPGEKFIKTWRIKNNGTCTWTKEYAIVLSNGDLMSAESPSFLVDEVNPGQIVDISIELVAPATGGSYKGNWLMQNDQGVKFGLGESGKNDFWVQIRVGESESDITSTLGDPTWIDMMNTADYWYLLDTQNSKFTQKEQGLEMISVKTGQNDEWGMSSYPNMKDFYLEITFITGPVCGSLDRYGVLFRAPDFDRGYVAGFSCDGRYRLYLWNGTQYIALQEWSSSNLIKPGANQTNRLGVWADGEVIRLFANGQLIKEFSSSTYLDGGFGLTISSVQTVNFSVIVDEVKYWELQH
jgi:hypothetical protein